MTARFSPRGGRASCRPLPVLLWPWMAALVWWLSAGEASAYPQWAFKGSGDCGSCHHSPSGGGLVSRWGREAADVSFFEDLGVGPLNDDLSHTAGSPWSPRVDLGADFRIVPLYGTDTDAPIGPVVIPMLTEIGGAVGFGPWVAYGAVTQMKAEDQLGTRWGSREHWLLYQAGDGYSVRFGRMVLPFGIRQPDHTQYVREDFGFDMYRQNYGVELDYVGSSWSVFANMFAGNLGHDPPARQERGLVVRATRNFEGGSSLGLSALGSASTARDRGALSLHGGLALGDSGYTLAEVAFQHLSARRGDDALSTVAEFARIGWFALPELDLYAEFGHRSATDEFTKARAAVGANWQVTNFLEIAPQALIESRSSATNRYLAQVQLHLVY